MNVDLNQTIVDFEKLVVDIEKDKDDLLVKLQAGEAKIIEWEQKFASETKVWGDKIAALEGQLLTPDNEKKLQDFISRLKALLPHAT